MPDSGAFSTADEFNFYFSSLIVDEFFQKIETINYQLEIRNFKWLKKFYSDFLD